MKNVQRKTDASESARPVIGKSTDPRPPAPPEPKPDANQSAAAVVASTIAKHEKPLPSDLEAAWAEWSRAVKNVDQRGMILLKAAFEAGAEAARKG